MSPEFEAVAYAVPRALQILDLGCGRGTLARSLGERERKEGEKTGEAIWLWLSKPMGSHFGVGEFTAHFRLPIVVGIGMFTGCTGF